MPIVICGLSDEGAGRPAPAVSALVEFGSALHVLRDPEHHEAAGWAAGVRSAMSPRLAAWTQAWWWTAQAIRATPFVTVMPPAGDFPESLASLRATSASRLGYRLASGPLGDFCESLHDLVAHVLMWDEINLAVLTEAAAGRAHWSLDPRWETPAAGRMLNRSGVEASRLFPASLLLHRLRTVRGQPAFWHAAIHLNQVPQQADAASRRGTPGETEPGTAGR